MALTAHTESNNTENVSWVPGRVPMFTFDMNMKSFIFAHFGVISLLYLFVCMYISYKAHNRLTKETLLIVSDVDVYMFPVLRSIPSCTTDMNLRSCILNRHKMRQSQNATIQESLPSHFVICRNLWSWPWRHTLSPITLKTCSVYLGENPDSLLTSIWKVAFLPILVLFHWYICLCACLSVIKLIIDVPWKPCWKGPILMWTCFLHLGVHPRLLWNLSKQLCFESSQNATVTNCDNSGILAVAFCDLSHFVIMAVTAHNESNNTENVFWVLGRVPRFTFHMNMKSIIFAHFGVISLLYLFVCVYISYKAHNRFTKETLLTVSDVDVYMFPVLRSIPSCTTDMNLRSCILNRHKMRQSQIATIQESLPSHFVICHILWSWPWRHTLSPITLKTCSGYSVEYPCSLLTWIWKVSFLPILALFHCYICLCVCISVIKPIIDLQRKPYWQCPTSMCTCFLYWGVYPLALRTWIWEVAFWTVTKCESHKLRPFRNPCRRILWFVAFCDHGRDGTNWVQ